MGQGGWVRRAARCGAAALVLGGLGGCGSTWGDGGAPARLEVNLMAPSVVRVPLDEARHGKGAGADLELTESPLLTGDVGPAGSADRRNLSAAFTLTVDARGLTGLGTLRTVSGTCAARTPVFRCAGTLTPHGGPSQRFRLTPAAGVASGATGTLRYTLTPHGGPARTGRISVLMGVPTLLVGEVPDVTGLTPGGTTAVPIVVRDTGDSTVGVSVSLLFGGGITPAERHRNCRYYVALMRCDFPRTAVAVGRTYAFRTPEVLRAGPRTTRSRLVLSASPYPPPSESAPASYTTGDGPPAELVPVGGENGPPAASTFRRQTSSAIGTSNGTDLVAVGDTAGGPVGSRETIHVGVRDDGPGELSGVDLVFVFRAPAGTTVVRSPYSAGNEEEQSPQQCRALDAHGNPMTAEAYRRQPSAPAYACHAYLDAGHLGRPATVAFTLRVDRAGPHPGGRVTVREPAGHSPIHDPVATDNTAAVTVRTTPGPSRAARIILVNLAWALPLLSAATTVIRRRRRTRRSGSTGTR